MTLVMTIASAKQKPTTGYAPVNARPAERSEGNEIGGIKMYYEVHGPDKPGFGKSGARPAPYGEPVVPLSRFRCAPFPFGGICDTARS